MGSHSARYALIVPCILECWHEYGIIRPKYVSTIKY